MSAQATEKKLNEKLLNTLIGPHITEKTSTAMQNANAYTFKVQRKATKPDVKAAVEALFNVQVLKVQLVNEIGKVRYRYGKTPGRTSDWKKAYVRLAQGQTIDYEARAKV
jgi:large subunit ribosomal protein L23